MGWAHDIKVFYGMPHLLEASAQDTIRRAGSTMPIGAPLVTHVE